MKQKVKIAFCGVIIAILGYTTGNLAWVTSGVTTVINAQNEIAESIGKGE